MSTPSLSVTSLNTEFVLKSGRFSAVSDVSFDVAPGEILGLVGESGSGKSITGYSIMGLIDPPGYVSSGSVMFQGRDLTTLSPHDMRKIRGNRIAMIFQDPTMSLNPVLRIDTQMVETVLAHDKVSRKEALSRSRDALAMVGIPSPEERLSAYPHQFSGGMRQRVAIAIAMLHSPDVIIADEPTTALDVTIQAQILSEMRTLTKQRNTALVWITHDLSVVAGLTDHLAVMYAGRIVETGRTRDVIDAPFHPYTRGLIASIPSRHHRGTRLSQIPGSMPSITSRPDGCAFRTRCERASEACRIQPPVEVRGNRSFRCFHPYDE